MVAVILSESVSERVRDVLDEVLTDTENRSTKQETIHTTVFCQWIIVDSCTNIVDCCHIYRVVGGWHQI